MRFALPALSLVAAAGCAPALHDPPTVSQLGPDVLRPGPTATGPANVDRLLTEAEGCYRRRDLPEQARAAQKLFLEAARADETRAEGLLGLARATAWLVEHASVAAERGSLVTVGVQAAQLCADRAPAAGSCDYALAIALGQQARERHATGHDGLAKMVAALRRAIASEPSLDGAGPHRVLALVYLRAPGWPAGPGDTEAGLAEAKEAVILAPDHPANQLALGEAFRRSGRPDEARAAYLHALELARQAADDPEAPEWLAEATKGLGPA
jgi:tetratricopeptide (TPR) repeat protein